MANINLTLDEIKAHLNLDHDLDNDLRENFEFSVSHSID